MKIAIVVPMMKISGGIAIALHYAESMARLGHHVDVLNLDGEAFDYWFDAPNINIISCKDPHKFAVFSSDVYDVAIGTLWLTIHQLRAGIIRANRILYLIQGDEENFYDVRDEKLRSLVRETYRGTETKVVVSPWLRKQLTDRYPDQTFHLLKNGIDIEKITEQDAFMPRGNKIRVLIEGAIDSPAKRVKETLLMLKDVIDIEVWLVSPTKGEVTTFCPDLTLFSVPFDKMGSIYSSCHIIVKNSQTEGLSLPVLEMMATGGVPIVNNFGAQEDYLVHKKNGLVIEHMKSTNLVDSLVYASENFERLSKAASETARRWAWTDQVHQLIKLIESSELTGNVSLRANFLNQDWSTRPNCDVIWQAKTLSPNTKNQFELLVGWLSHVKGGDVINARIVHDGSSYGLSATVDRQDVAAHFNASGTYGYALSTKMKSGDEFVFQTNIAGRWVDFPAIVPAGDILPHVFRFGDIFFTIEKLPHVDEISFDITESPTLTSIYVEFQRAANVRIRGQSVETQHLFENTGRLSFSQTSMKRCLEVHSVK